MPGRSSSRSWQRFISVTAAALSTETWRQRICYWTTTSTSKSQVCARTCVFALKSEWVGRLNLVVDVDAGKCQHVLREHFSVLNKMFTLSRQLVRLNQPLVCPVRFWFQQHVFSRPAIEDMVWQPSLCCSWTIWGKGVWRSQSRYMGESTFSYAEGPAGLKRGVWLADLNVPGTAELKRKRKTQTTTFLK